MALQKIRQQLARHKLDGLLVSKEANIAYLCGFEGEGQLLITPKKKILAVDFRYGELAEKQTKSWQIWRRLSFSPPEKSLAKLIKKLKLHRLGFEADALSYESYRILKKAFAPAKFLPTHNIVEQIRAIKGAQEIKLIKKAAALAVKSMAYAAKIIRPGKTEKEVAQELQYFMRKSGAQDSAFGIIVAAGKRSSMPHAPLSDKAIKQNEAVLVDLGCRLRGYNSDLTRMVFLGKMRAKIKHIYDIVLRAQKKAIETIKAGEKISQIDRIARHYLAKEGLGTYFGHALGHGIGREVHEYPSISPKNRDVLKEGMVLTIEPGVYIQGVGGVRVEDMILVKKNGCEILTR